MKNILQSKTAWGAIVSAILGLLALLDVRVTEAETAPVIEAFALILSFAFTLYGRLKATVPVKIGKLTGKNITLWVLGLLCLAPLLITQTGCSSTQWGQDNPRAAQLIDSVAHAAIIMAINDQAAHSDTIAEHAATLKQSAAAAFATGASEAEIASSIAESVFAIYPDDSEARDTLLAGFRAALADPDPDGAGVPASDQDRVSAQLFAGHLEAAFARQTSQSGDVVIDRAFEPVFTAPAPSQY